MCVSVCTVKGAGVQDARGDAGIHATIKSAPQEAGRVAEIREGYYQPANSSLSLGSAPHHIPLNAHTHTHTHLHTYALIWAPTNTHTHTHSGQAGQSL